MVIGNGNNASFWFNDWLSEDLVSRLNIADHDWTALEGSISDYLLKDGWRVLSQI